MVCLISSPLPSLIFLSSPSSVIQLANIDVLIRRTISQLRRHVNHPSSNHYHPQCRFYCCDETSFNMNTPIIEHLPNLQQSNTTSRWYGCEKFRRMGLVDLVGCAVHLQWNDGGYGSVITDTQTPFCIFTFLGGIVWRWTLFALALRMRTYKTISLLS